MFVGALDLTVVSAVLPAVLVDLRVPLQEGLADASWAVSGYLAAYVLGMLVMGRASDRLGRREAFLVALAIFAAGSLASAASPDIFGRWVRTLERALGAGALDPSAPTLHALVAGRVVQGFGAGALVPVAMAVAADLFTKARAAAIGAVAAVDTSGWVLGHLYGGAVVQAFPWPALFWVNLPLAAIAAAVAWSALGRLGARDPRAPLDVAGTALLGIALAGITLAVGGNERHGAAALTQVVAAPPYALPAGALGLVAFAAFAFVELRAAAPLVELRALAERAIASAALANATIGWCVMFGLVSVPLLVNTVGALDAREGALASGELLSLLTVPFALAAVPGGALAARAGWRSVAATGLAVAAAGCALISRWDVEAVRAAVDAVAGRAPAGSAVAVVVGLGLVGIGLGLASAPLAAVLIDRGPAARRGSSAALVIALRLLGMSVSAAALTSFGLRRLGAIAQEHVTELSATDPDRALEAGRRLAVSVTAEMALVAAAAALIGLAAVILARERPTYVRL